jgi:hypothetical protein
MEIKTPWLVLENGSQYQLDLGDEAVKSDQKITEVTADQVSSVLAQNPVGFLGCKGGVFVNTAYVVEIRDSKKK